MLLESKTAVIYGAGGAIGSGVAEAFAREGAFVHLTGHHVESLREVAERIAGAGGLADVARVDAFDEAAVGADLDRLAAERGAVDVSFNAVSFEQDMGDPLTQVSVDQFRKSTSGLVVTNFITMTAAARRMMERGSGTLLAITATPAKLSGVGAGTFSVAGAAVEALCRQLAVDLGPSGIRVVCLRSAGSPDAKGVSATMDHLAQQQGITREEFEAGIASQSLLKRMPRVAEFANAAVVMASDYASAFTGAAANVNCGEVVD